MSSTLTKIKLLGIIITTSILAKAHISQECNTPRNGDRMSASSFDVTTAIFSDSCADFSNAVLTDAGKMQVFYPSDNSIFVLVGNASTRMTIGTDTMSVLSEGKPGQFITARISEPELFFGNNLKGVFCKSGTAGAETFVGQYGLYSFNTVENTTFVSCDGDIYNGSTVVEYCTESALVTGNASDYAQMFDTISALDIAAHDFATDSLSHRQCRRRWFARGFRYPIVDIRCDTLLSFGTPIDASATAIYLSPELQRTELDNDFANESLRAAQYKSMRMQTIRPETKVSTSGSLTLRLVSARPVLKFEIESAETGTCYLTISDLSGRILKDFIKDIKADAVNQGIEIVTESSDFPNGAYLVSASQNKYSASIKFMLD